MKRVLNVVKSDVAVACVCVFVGVSTLGAVGQYQRELAFRTMCGANLATLGKAMFAYANDYEGELPRSGGRSSLWASQIPSWTAVSRFQAYGVSAATGDGGQATVTSNLYLLVKYARVLPKDFICRSDIGAREFKLKDTAGTPANFELIDAWDFGPWTDSTHNPSRCCSYAYHAPFGPYALTTNRNPGLAVLADRNPWMDPARVSDPNAGWSQFVPDPMNPPDPDQALLGNSDTHHWDGQNVLFLNGQVSFETRATCGVDQDNIFTYAQDTSIAGRTKGTYPVAYENAASRVGSPNDSVLVQEYGSGTGGSNSGTKRRCFVAGTPALVDGKLVQIQDVTADRTIRSLQEHEGTFVCRDILLETGNTIGVVDAHRFLTDSGHWVAAQNLTTSLRLRTLTGTIGIKSITLRSYTGKVYNLKIRGSHQYMVGEDAVIVRDF
jgi:hypothetical protein